MQFVTLCVWEREILREWMRYAGERGWGERVDSGRAAALSAPGRWAGRVRSTRTRLNVSNRFQVEFVIN
jgi:hypothetical protein